MKRHPVDDFFKEKLYDLEKRPSAHAWTRIENEKKAAKRKSIGWVWYMAAGITAALLAGYLFWQNQTEQDLNQKNGRVIANVKKADKALPAISADSPEQKDQENAGQVKEEQIAMLNREKLQFPEKSFPSVQKDKPRVQKTELSIENLPDYPELTLLVNNLPDKIRVNRPDSVIQQVIEDQPVKNVLLAETQESSKNRTIVVSIDDPESQDNEKSKTSRFTKVFRQLKNVRAGEPVNWKDVGFNPKSIVAKVDERIRDKEEEISEKYQHVKEKTKL